MIQTDKALSVESSRILGLDSIRFICAAFVVFDHLGFIEIPKNTQHLHSFQNLMRTTSEALFNGPAAVIMFFLISGFCIHYPFRNPNRPLPIAGYLSRRLIRVGLPALAFILYLRFVLHDNSPIFQTVLWSVVCEIIYYTLYPILRPLRHKYGWESMIGISYAIGLGIALSHLKMLSIVEDAYTAFGYQLTWLIGLPVWLAGCWLAENMAVFKAPTRRNIWILRAMIFVLTFVLRIAKFHTTAPFFSNVITLNLFAFPACYWLGCEIAYLSKYPPQKTLEHSGRWSYSVYLAHILIVPTIALFGGATFVDRRHWGLHFLLLAFVFIISYGFFLIIEQPSHKLAIKISKLLNFQSKGLANERA